MSKIQHHNVNSSKLIILQKVVPEIFRPRSQE